MDLGHINDVTNFIKTVSGLEQLSGLNSTWTVTNGSEVVNPLVKSMLQYQQSFDQLQQLQTSHGLSQPSPRYSQLPPTPEPENENFNEIQYSYPPIQLPTLTVPPFIPVPANTNLSIPQPIPGPLPTYSPLPISSPLPLLALNASASPTPSPVSGQSLPLPQPGLGVGQEEKRAIQQTTPAVGPATSVSQEQIDQMKQLGTAFEFESASATPQQQQQVPSSAVKQIDAFPQEEGVDVQQENSTYQLPDIFSHTSIPATGNRGIVAAPLQQLQNLNSQQNMQNSPQLLATNGNGNGNRNTSNIQPPTTQSANPIPFFLQGNFSAVRIPSSSDLVPSFLTAPTPTPIPTPALATMPSTGATPPTFASGVPFGANVQQQQRQTASNINQGGNSQVQRGQTTNTQTGGGFGNNILGVVGPNIQTGQISSSNNIQGGNPQVGRVPSNGQGGTPQLNNGQVGIVQPPTYAPSCGRSDNPGAGTLCGCTNQVPCDFQACMLVYAMGSCDNPDVAGQSDEAPFGYCDVTCDRCDCCPSVLQQSKNLNLTFWAEMVQIVLDATGGDVGMGMNRMGPTGSVVTSLTNPSNKATIFVPTDEAFEALLEKTSDSKQNFLSKIPMLQEIIQAHMVMSYSAMSAEELWSGELTFTLPTQLGGERNAYLDIDPQDSVESMTIRSPGATAKIQFPNINGCETIMHIVDQVLLPFEVEDNTGRK